MVYWHLGLLAAKEWNVSHREGHDPYILFAAIW